MTTPATITSVTVAADVTDVQEYSVYQFDFSVPVPLDQGCIVEVVFPTEVTLDGAKLSAVDGLGFFGA